jgi:MipA family protein
MTRKSHTSLSRALQHRPSIRTCVAVLAMFAACSASYSAAAEKLPLWEVGAGAALINFPDYRGSDERPTYLLPVPYVVYRGETLQVDRQRVRGLLFSGPAAELDVSVSGSVPVRSRHNKARQKMPDLDPTLEIGPSLIVSLHRTPASSLELRVPVRAIVASDFKDVSYQGFVFHPHVNFDLKGVFPGPGWNLGLLVGPVFADRRYHEYFYGVSPQFAAPGRPAYEAKAGYSGMQFIASVSKRFQNYWVGGFVKADSLHGTAFEDSPLVKQKHALAGGVAVAYIFGKSKQMVEARE